MKQIVITDHGGPEKLKIQESPVFDTKRRRTAHTREGERYQLRRHPGAPGALSGFTEDSVRSRV